MRTFLRTSSLLAVFGALVLSYPVSSASGSTATRSNRLNCSGSCSNGSSCSATGSACTCECDIRGNAHCTCKL